MTKEEKNRNQRVNILANRIGRFIQEEDEETLDLINKKLAERFGVILFDAKNVRLCSHCGKPMKEGYCISDGDEYACSEECALALYGGDKEAMDADLKLVDSCDAPIYWTEWESYLFD